jgi:hypothetical protein
MVFLSTANPTLRLKNKMRLLFVCTACFLINGVIMSRRKQPIVQALNYAKNGFITLMFLKVKFHLLAKIQQLIALVRHALLRVLCPMHWSTALWSFQMVLWTLHSLAILPKPTRIRYSLLNIWCVVQWKRFIPCYM